MVDNVFSVSEPSPSESTGFYLTCITQGSVLALNILLLFINDFLPSTTNPINSHPDDAIIHCSFSYRNLRHKNAKIEHGHNVASASLNSDFGHICS